MAFIHIYNIYITDMNIFKHIYISNEMCKIIFPYINIIIQSYILFVYIQTIFKINLFFQNIKHVKKTHISTYKIRTYMYLVWQKKIKTLSNFVISICFPWKHIERCTFISGYQKITWAIIHTRFSNCQKWSIITYISYKILSYKLITM
jgi:hypothetical protein